MSFNTSIFRERDENLVCIVHEAVAFTSPEEVGGLCS